MMERTRSRMIHQPDRMPSLTANRICVGTGSARPMSEKICVTLGITNVSRKMTTPMPTNSMRMG